MNGVGRGERRWWLEQRAYDDYMSVNAGIKAHAVSLRIDAAD